MLMFQAVNFKRAEAAASDHTLDLFGGVLRNERHWLPCPPMKPSAIWPSFGFLARWRHCLARRPRAAARQPPAMAPRSPFCPEGSAVNTAFALSGASMPFHSALLASFKPRTFLGK